MVRVSATTQEDHVGGMTEMLDVPATVHLVSEKIPAIVFSREDHDPLFKQSRKMYILRTETSSRMLSAEQFEKYSDYPLVERDLAMAAISFFHPDKRQFHQNSPAANALRNTLQRQYNIVM